MYFWMTIPKSLRNSVGRVVSGLFNLPPLISRPMRHSARVDLTFLNRDAGELPEKRGHGFAASSGRSPPGLRPVVHTFVISVDNLL